MAAGIPEKTFKEIEASISSEESVVGIDAKKTHIIIIHMLMQLEEKINSLENRLSEIEKKV